MPGDEIGVTPELQRVIHASLQVLYLGNTSVRLPKPMFKTALLATALFLSACHATYATPQTADGLPANVIRGSVVLADLTLKKERYTHLIGDEELFRGVVLTHVMRERFGEVDYITFRGHRPDGNSVVTAFPQNHEP